jgi:hypothetical protein
MSLTILLMTSNSIHAIADKRVSNRDFSFVHDNDVKIRPIRKDLFLSGIGECDISNFWLETLKSVGHLTVSEMLEIAGKLPRERQVLVNKELPYCSVIIFGIDDNNQLFFWVGHPNGSIELIQSSSNMICRIIGMNADDSPNSTVNRVSSHFQNLLVSGVDIQTSMMDSLRFGATIDPVVSPTCDYLEISKNLILN